MNSERLNHIENLDRQKEGLINLDSLSFEFCDDNLAHNFYNEKIRSIEDKEKWIKENKNKIEQNKDKIAKAVEDGLITDTNPETIWQFQIDKAKKAEKGVLRVKNELEGRIEEIKAEVDKRLSEFLPDLSPDQAKIVFTMNEKADFCIDNNTITVDLERLLFEKSPIEKTKEGITHEVFHLWMSEKSEWSDSEQDEASDQSLKDRIIFKTVDEGLAVLIGNQSLEAHHAQQGRSFTEYKEESFESFRHFLSERDREILEKIKEEEFQNMGHFYVVGNEIARAVLQNDGMEKFREHIVEARDNPTIFLQRYKEICNENNELLRI